MSSAKSDAQYDVAIVGGGVAGIYSGWRLLTGNPGESAILREWVAARSGKLKVAVFEGSERIGGRLLSARPPGFSDATACEIGGMRYVSTQEHIRGLVEDELKLPHYNQTVDLDCNIVYLRGKQLRFSQAKDPATLPYNLDWAESQYIKNNNDAGKKNNDPSGLLGWAIAKLLPGVNRFTGPALDDYLQKAKIDGTLLYCHGFWNLLARTLSPDAYDAARALVGYDCLGSNANAVDLIAEYFKFTPDVHYRLLNGGYESVPWTLQRKFKAKGGEVIPNSWLAGFDKTTLEDGSTGVMLHFRGDQPPVTARALILAMPRRSLELLKREGPVLDPAQAPHFEEHLLNSVRPIPLYKLFLVYEYPWWNAVGVSKGRSLTDIPVRQTYYWPVDPAAETPSAHGKALLMGYNDATSVDFWAGLSGTGKRKHDPAKQQHFRRWLPETKMFARVEATGDESADRNGTHPPLLENWRAHQAPQAMVNEMHRQMMSMHGIQYAPTPIDAAYMDWSVDPFGGGVHFWNRGYKSWDIVDQMTQPVENFPCYICGEAYSRNQTWVEGALETAEIVLQQHLGLHKPSWVKAEARRASHAGAD